MDMTPENLARLMEDRSACKIVKDDTSASVGIADGSVFDLPFAISIKRFYGKGLLHPFLRRIFGSRARHLMNISSQLAAKGLPVPKPVAYFEHTLGMHDAFFISEALKDSENLGTVASMGNFDPGKSFETGLAKAISEWHCSGAVHGDLKWSNILYQRTGDIFRFYMIDLDQACIHRSVYRKGIFRDLVRFFRYGLELGQETWVEHRFFPLYTSYLSACTDISADLPEIMRQARQEWTSKGSRKIVKS